MDTSAIEKAIEQLSLKERLSLIERTLDKMYASSQTILSSNEIDKRFKEIDSGKAQMQNASDVINRLKKQYLV